MAAGHHWRISRYLNSFGNVSQSNVLDWDQFLKLTEKLWTTCAEGNSDSSVYPKGQLIFILATVILYHQHPWLPTCTCPTSKVADVS